jgi:hypothetical protein
MYFVQSVAMSIKPFTSNLDKFPFICFPDKGYVDMRHIDERYERGLRLIIQREYQGNIMKNIIQREFILHGPSSKI